METKTARLTVLMDPDRKKAFEELCAERDLTPSQVVRQLVREYMDRHETSIDAHPNRGNGDTNIDAT